MRTADFTHLEQRVLATLQNKQAFRVRRPRGNTKEPQRITNGDRVALLASSITEDGRPVDPYTVLAAERYGIPESQVTPSMRAFEKRARFMHAYSQAAWYQGGFAQFWTTEDGTPTGRYTK